MADEKNPDVARLKDYRVTYDYPTRRVGLEGLWRRRMEFWTNDDGEPMGAWRWVRAEEVPTSWGVVVTASCRSCASCERELSAVRLELQAVVRERDQYRGALERVATHARLDEKERGFGESSRFRGIAEHALGRERKDTE